MAIVIFISLSFIWYIASDKKKLKNKAVVILRLFLKSLHAVFRYSNYVGSSPSFS